MKKILVISSSLRNGSNSEILAKKFFDGAKDAGNDVEYLSLKNKKINFCQGCLACQQTRKCIIDDDMNKINDKIKNADVLCFASPIYYYGMSGLLKTMLDRVNPLYGTDYKFREIYLIATCYDADPLCLERFVNGIEGWTSCFEKCSIKGILKGNSLNEPNEANTNIAKLNEAYKLGLNV